MFNSNHLVESVKVNRSFGADYFLFYNLTICPNVDEYMRCYVNTGVTDATQWQLSWGNSSSNYDDTSP